MSQQPTAAPMLGELSEPAARVLAWATLGAGAVALAVAAFRNLTGGRRSFR